MPHGQSSGRTQPCSVRVTSLPSCPAARSVLCRGPLGPGDAEHSDSRAEVPGSEGKLPAEGGEGGGGGGPGRTRAPSADSCCSLQPPASSGSPILPGSYGSLRGTVPHRRWAQPGVGPLALAAGRYKACLPLGCVPRLVCGRCCRAPITPVNTTARVSLWKACRSSTCKAGGRESR